MEEGVRLDDPCEIIDVDGPVNTLFLAIHSSKACRILGHYACNLGIPFLKHWS